MNKFATEWNKIREQADEQTFALLDEAGMSHVSGAKNRHVLFGMICAVIANSSKEWDELKDELRINVDSPPFLKMSFLGDYPEICKVLKPALKVQFKNVEKVKELMNKN